MILTCPECSTSYMAKDGSIGPNGRSVQCVKCDAVWFAEARNEDPDAMALEDNKGGLITPEPTTIAPSQADLELDRKSETTSKVPSASIVPATIPVGAHILLREKADAEKLTKRKRAIRGIWTVPVVCLLGLATVAIFSRQNIVEAYPKTATIYSTFGMDVKSNGLDIRGLTSERLIVDGDVILRVTGEVVNLTSQAKSAPLVQLRLDNRSGEALADWFIEPGTIPAEASVKIETDYPAPPLDGVELRYRFAPNE